VTAGIPESGIMPGWEYQWLVAIPEARGSWVLPLAVSRRSLNAGTPTALAIAQLQTVLAAAGEAPERPVVVFDSHSDVPALVRAVPAVDFLARLACNRRFYRAPPAYGGTGRPRVHGAIFRLKAPTTQGEPDRHQMDEDPDYGAVTIDVWERLHTQAAATVEVTVMRVAVAHLPRRTTAPAPLWLAWHGTTLPDDLRVVWHWYQRRFAIEHAFRFLKQDLGWTVPRRRDPAAADRWTGLLATALWELWLARSQVVDARAPSPSRTPQPGAGAAAHAWPSGPLGHAGPAPPSARKVAGPTGRRPARPGPALSDPTPRPAAAPNPALNCPS